MPESSLRDRLAEALRTAAFLCDDRCTLEDEAACDAAHPFQATCLHFDQVADIAGPVDAIADAMAAVVQPELDAGEIAFEKRGQIITRLEARAQKAEAKVTWLAESHNDALNLIIRLSDERDGLRDQLAAAGLLPVPRPPGATELPCSLAIIRTFQGQLREHCSHTWAPQPGVTPAWCPGINPNPPTPVGTSTATTNELPVSVDTWHTLGHCPDQANCPLHPLPGAVLESGTEEGLPCSAVANCDGQCCQQAEPTCGVMNPRKAATCTEAEQHPDDTHRDAFGNTWPRRTDDKPLFPKET